MNSNTILPVLSMMLRLTLQIHHFMYNNNMPGWLLKKAFVIKMLTYANQCIYEVGRCIRTSFQVTVLLNKRCYKFY
ncbi:hypothetical protein AAZX31_12G070400 [Glycine max]